MKIETYLNAMKDCALRVVLNDEPNKGANIRHRQYHAFRDRILKMFAEKEAIIQYHYDTQEIAHQNGVLTIAAKDERIVELEERIQTLWWDQND